MANFVKDGNGTVLIPVGLHGGFRVFPGESLMPTLEGTLGVLFSRKMVDIKIGVPVTSDEVLNSIGENSRQRSPEEITTFLMRRVVELLPPNARGVYA